MRVSPVSVGALAAAIGAAIGVAVRATAIGGALAASTGGASGVVAARSCGSGPGAGCGGRPTSLGSSARCTGSLIGRSGLVVVRAIAGTGGGAAAGTRTDSTTFIGGGVAAGSTDGSFGGSVDATRGVARASGIRTVSGEVGAASAAALGTAPGASPFTSPFTSSGVSGLSRSTLLPRRACSCASTSTLSGVSRLMPSRMPWRLYGFAGVVHASRITHSPRSTGVPSASWIENAVS